MIFTREPIIETIITPREGYKLSVRSSKGEGNEEYQVDALEIVSFNGALFFRSQERPKCFLLPVSDYEVIETRETRIVLKSATPEKAIKIGGGREPAKVREPAPEKKELQEEEKSEYASSEEGRFDRKRDRRRNNNNNNRRRRPGEERQEWQKKPAENSPEGDVSQEKEPLQTQGGDSSEETQIPPSFTSLIPPPTMLISDTLSRYKDAAFYEEKKGNGQAEEKKKKKQPSKEEADEEEKNEPPAKDSSGTEVELHEETIFFSPDPDSPYIP